MRIGYEDPDTLITYPRAHNLSACAQPIRMRCTRPAGAPGGTRALAVKTQPLRVAATAMEWFPNNVARNFPVNLSVIEICLLQFQRFWAQAKTDRRKLRARLQERVVRTAHDREAVPRGIIRRLCEPATARPR